MSWSRQSVRYIADEADTSGRPEEGARLLDHIGATNAALVLFREQDRKDPLCDARVGRIGRSVLHLPVVAIDPPEYPRTVVIEGAEIVLA
jgi:hypothetical protein